MDIFFTLATLILSYKSIKLIKAYDKTADNFTEQLKMLGWVIVSIFIVTSMSVSIPKFPEVTNWQLILLITNAVICFVLLSILVYEKHKSRIEWSNKFLENLKKKKP
jgi:hypothetical protein